MDVFKALKGISLPLSRLSIFIIYFWFGSLKLIDASPANPLVGALLNKTLPFIEFDQFIIFFGVWEMVIGIIFLIRGLEKIALTILVVHMVTTFMPLFLLPTMGWQGFLIPTLEGQYMIKNLITLALAINIVTQTKLIKK